LPGSSPAIAIAGAPKELPVAVAKRKPGRDVEKACPPGRFVITLRRLADAIERGTRFRIQIAGRRVVVPRHAKISIEHEQGPSEEEVELQLRWSRE